MTMRILTDGIRALAAALGTIVDRIEKEVECFRSFLEKCEQAATEISIISIPSPDNLGP